MVKDLSSIMNCMKNYSGGRIVYMFGTVATLIVT